MLAEGADPTFVARSLAGLDSPKAWELRERLLKKGVDKGLIAQGIAGDDSTFVLRLQPERKMKEISTECQQKLVLLNLVHDPSLDRITEWQMTSG